MELGPLLLAPHAVYVQPWLSRLIAIPRLPAVFILVALAVKGPLQPLQGRAPLVGRPAAARPAPGRRPAKVACTPERQPGRALELWLERRQARRWVCVKQRLHWVPATAPHS